MNHTVDEWEDFYEYIIARMIEKIVSKATGYIVSNPLLSFLKIKNIHPTDEQCARIVADMTHLSIISTPSHAYMRKDSDYRRYHILLIGIKAKQLAIEIASVYLLELQKNKNYQQIQANAVNSTIFRDIFDLIAHTWDEFVNKEYAYDHICRCDQDNCPDLYKCTNTIGNKSCVCLSCRNSRMNNPIKKIG